MQTDVVFIIISILGAGVVAWGAGRILARRIPPWRRRPWAVMVTVLLVIGLIIANNIWNFLPRGYLRMVMMFVAIGWIIGVIGCKDEVG